MERRHFIATTGATFLSSIAGCFGSDENSTNNSNSNENEDSWLLIYASVVSEEPNNAEIYSSDEEPIKDIEPLQDALNDAVEDGEYGRRDEVTGTERDQYEDATDHLERYDNGSEFPSGIYIEHQGKIIAVDAEIRSDA